MQPKISPKQDQLVLQSRALDYRGSAIVEARAEPPSESSRETQHEAYEADRAFHAGLARFTAGISPVAPTT